MPDRQRGWIDCLSPAQRSILLDRQWLVLHWGAALGESRRNGQSKDQITHGVVLAARQRGLKISRGTLFNWRRAFLADGLFGLMDNRWFKKHPSAFWPFIMALSHIYLRGSGRGKTVEFCHAEATKLAEDYNWPRCTLAQSRRWIRGHLEPSKVTDCKDGLTAD
jgi:hypothetical protein